jgi:hypothetical protein
MDEKTRLRKFAIGMALTLVAAVLAGVFLGGLGVSLALGLGLLVTIALGGGLSRKG